MAKTKITTDSEQVTEHIQKLDKSIRETIETPCRRKIEREIIAKNNQAVAQVGG